MEGEVWRVEGEVWRVEGEMRSEKVKSMKRSIILGIVAVVLLVLYAIYMSPVILPICAIILIAVFANEYYRRRHTTDDVKPYELTVDELTAQYGDPEDVILVNATRANEAMGVILAYNGFLVVEGRRIEKSDITGVTFNNSGTPYARGEYQIIIDIRQGQEYLHVNAGYDAAWTKDVAELIKKNL